MLTLKNQKKAIRSIAWNIRKISFIIGAGFSKNISKKYMSWWELMQDMVTEMYVKDITFHNMFVDDVIKKVGYLGIASEYVRRKGYHEAIDDYIEKRTPVLVDNNNGGHNLELNGRTIEYNVDTSIHRALLNLMPKNIYTFNYDNAFECHKDKVRIANKEANPLIEEELHTLQDILFNEYRKHEVSINSALRNAKVHPDEDEYTSQLDEAIKSYNDNIVNKVSSYISLDILTKDIDIIKQLEQNRSALYERVDALDNDISAYRNNKNTFLLATKGSDISISTYDNAIYKLHGSLRKYDSEAHKYIGDIGFDSDSHVQYIITQEDYDTYHVKHEPFVDLMRISLLKESFCIIGFSCDDPNFLLWINWVKDVYERAKDQKEKKGHKYYINVEDYHLPDDKFLLLKSHYIDIINLAEIYPSARNPKDRLFCFFSDLVYNGYETDIYSILWSKTNLWMSSVKDSELKYNPEHIEIAWNESLVNPLYFMDNAFNHSRDSIPNYFGRVISNNQVNDSLFKLFYLAVTRACLPYKAFIPDKYNDIFMNLIESENVKSRYIQEDEFQKLLTSGECNIDCFPKVLQHQIGDLIRKYNYDYKDYDSFFLGWNPSCKLEKVLKFVLQPKNHNIQEIISGFLHQEDYLNSQEYLLGLELLNYYRWSAGYNKISSTLAKRISDEIRYLKDNQPKLIDLYKYKDEIEKHLNVKSEVKPFGNISTSIKFSDYDDVATSSIKFITFLAKGGFTTNFGISNFVDKKIWIKVVENAYAYYPYACLYYSSLYYNDYSLSKRIGQLYAYNHNLVDNGIIEGLLIKILNACLHYESNVYIGTLLSYAHEFINVVRYSSWQNLLQDIIDRNELISWDSHQWHEYDNVFNFVEHGIELMNDDNYKYKLVLKILHKGSNINNEDNSILLKCLKRNNYTAEIKNAIFGLTKLPPTLALAMVIFNYRGALSSKVFNRWLRNVPNSILGSKVLLPAISMLSAHNKSLKEMTFNLIEHSLLLWNTGIELGADGKVTSIYGGVDTLYIDSIEEYVTIPNDLAKTIYGSLDKRLDEIEKAIGRGFYDQMNEYWCLVLVSVYCFLVRHKNDLKNANDYNEIESRCHKLYTDICGYESVLRKLTSSKAYKVGYAISELEILINTNGIKSYLTEITFLVFHIADKSCATVYNGLLLIIKLIKKHHDIFRKEGLREGLVLMLNNYKPYFNRGDSDDWDINARKELVERMLMHISKYLTEIGYPVHAWDNYKPEFWINEKVQQ